MNTTNVSRDDGVNEESNENSVGVGGGNKRGGYQGRRDFRGKGEPNGFGLTI